MIFRLGGPLVIVALLAVWVVTLVSIIRTPDHAYRAGNQIVWLLIVIFLPLIGVPLYWIFGAPQR
jgi:hypothetical protein